MTNLTSKLRSFTIEAWAFTAIAGPVFSILNALGFDGAALGVFAASILVAGIALVCTLGLGVRALVVS